MKPRFSLQRLFLSVTLICLGIGILVSADKFIVLDGLNLFEFFPVLAVVYCSVGALIMAGIFALFGKMKLGAIIGILLPFAFVAFLLITYLLHPVIG